MNSNKIYILLAVFVGTILGATFSNLSLEFLSKNTSLLLTIIGIIICLVGVFFVAVFFLRKEINQEFFGVKNEELKGLNKSVVSLIEGFFDKDKQVVKDEGKYITKKLITWYSWLKIREWTIVIFQALFVCFGGLLGTVLLYNQNEIMTQQKETVDNQNLLITAQNIRLDQQTYLQEADRRSSYIFLLSSIYEQIYNELGKDYLENGIRDLSPQLIGGISSLSRGLKPYRLLEGDSLSNELSPERGLLLSMLVESNLSDSAYEKIFNVSDFSYADLRRVSFVKSNLKGAHLYNADFYGANLYGTNLSNSGLQNAKFNYATIVETNFHNANLMYADMENAFVPQYWIDSIKYMNKYALENYKETSNNALIYAAAGVISILNNYEVSEGYTEMVQMGKYSFERKKLIKKK